MIQTRLTAAARELLELSKAQATRIAELEQVLAQPEAQPSVPGRPSDETIRMNWAASLCGGTGCSLAQATRLVDDAWARLISVAASPQVESTPAATWVGEALVLEAWRAIRNARRWLSTADTDSKKAVTNALVELRTVNDDVSRLAAQPPAEGS